MNKDKKILITKIVLTCIAFAIFIVSLSFLLAAPESRSHSKYYIYKNPYSSEKIQEANEQIDASNALHSSEPGYVPEEKYLDFSKVEIYLKKDGMYTVITLRDGKTEESEKIPYFVGNGRIFLDITKSEYNALSNTKKSEVVSLKISGSSMNYYTPKVLEAEDNIASYYYKETEKHNSMTHFFVPFAIIGFILTVACIISLVIEIRENKRKKLIAEGVIAEKPKRQKITFKSIQDKVTKKVLVSLAVVTALCGIVGAVLASGKYATHVGTYAISDEELPKSLKDTGNTNYQIHFTKDGVVETFETTEHYVLSEPTKYLVKGGRLFLDITAEDYKEIIDGFKELEATRDERNELLDLMAEDINTLRYETRFGGLTESLVFKSSLGKFLQIFGYVLLGIGGLALIELIISLSQKFVYALVVARASVPEGFGGGEQPQTPSTPETEQPTEHTAKQPAEQPDKQPAEQPAGQPAEAPAEQTEKADVDKGETKKRSKTQKNKK